MEFTINSKRLGKPVTFSLPDGYYIYINLNGQPGTLGEQICRGGKLTGSTISFDSDDQQAFEGVCRRWWRSYLKNNKGML